MEHPFAVVYGTEENFFEPEVEFFDSKKEATAFRKQVAHEITDEGYEYFARVCADEEHYQLAMDEIAEMRETWIEDAGFDEN